MPPRLPPLRVWVSGVWTPCRAPIPGSAGNEVEEPHALSPSTERTRCENRGHCRPDRADHARVGPLARGPSESSGGLGVEARGCLQGMWGPLTHRTTDSTSASRQPSGNQEDVETARSRQTHRARILRGWTPCSTRTPGPRVGRGRAEEMGGEETTVKYLGPCKSIRWRCARGRRAFRSSSASPTCSARARRCERRSSRETPTRWCCTGRRGRARRRWRGWSPSARAAAFEELSAVQAGRAEVRAVIERAAHRRAASASGRRRRAVSADRAVPGRDPPLQQGPAGRAAAGRRGGPASR